MAKIIHFGKYYLPDMGGIESVTVSLARGGVLASHHVTVICFEKTPAPKQETIDGVNVVRTSVGMLISSQPLSFKYFWMCLALAKRESIVHLHVPNMLGALCALFLRGNTRLIVHWHSDVINKGLLGRFIRPLERLLLGRADTIIATSKVYVDSSETLRPFRKKVEVIPIGVPDVKADKVGDLPSHINKLVRGRKIILAVGRLVPYKGFDVLIAAAHAISEGSVIIIVGSGPLQEKLQKTIIAAGLENRVILTGRLTDEALHTLFCSAYLYCMPSTFRAEAFGVVLLEAMSHGLPIVATNILGSGVPWVNEHGKSGINVPVNNPQKLAEACNQILLSKDLHDQLSRGARQRFLSEFTEEVAVNRVLNVYKRLAGPGHSSAK